MRKSLMCLSLIAALGLSACETTGGGYGAPTSQLSQCTRNALIGAGVGAVLGAATAPEGNRTENAAMGAAIGGGGTFLACRWLTARDQQRVENSYRQALAANQPVRDNWASDDGSPRSLAVSAPTQAPGRPANCKTVQATVNDGRSGAQPLPAETYCRTPDGVWVPA